MPVLELTDRAMPRSALRHRPLGSDVDQQGMAGITPIAQRASRLRSPVSTPAQFCARIILTAHLSYLSPLKTI